MTYIYINPEHTLITNGQGAFIPVDNENKDYQRIIKNNILILPYVEPSETIPNITATQMLIVLQSMGFITQAEATDRTQFPAAFSALLTGNPSQDAALKIRWANLTFVERNNPLVEAFSSVLSLTSEQIDNMFIQAAQI